MALKICVFEDARFSQFYPLTRLRPVYTLRAGIRPLFSRAERFFERPDLCLVAREQVASLLAEQFKEYPVNIIKREPDSEILFLNGRIRDFGDLPKLARESRLSTVFKHEGEVVAVLFKRESLRNVPALATPDRYLEAYRAEAAEIPDLTTTATLYNYSWDLVADIEHEIIADFASLTGALPPGANRNVHPAACLIDEANIVIGNDVTIAPFALLDASHGPIYIEANCRIEAHAAIYGPCYIGANSVVLAGKITGSSIGHTCRVGGEVEESIFHSYVNKYHAGFIGHSYVGSWVNFGAMTTNSDLKNNYSTIRATINGRSVDTGLQKVGSCIGDHTKFGIGTLLNTGISIGLCCNIFGGGLTTDKEVPSFSWGNTDRYRTFALDKAVQTARIVAERRNTVFSEREIELLRAAHENVASTEGILEF
jgi:UDP-N-acetylglucosamine diphosphorylase / glucose-1-phosphate thymidylyltransferase / UDP-N-acetylgalactosamine diphosphorylase / glucosamine-1-phosphate N-acetyltransferase / galactosamine-1-phosphate N-acetyltransferase